MRTFESSPHFLMYPNASFLSRTLSKTMGLPPTDRKARTGLLTPPGMMP
jgi:hypothetical protein